MSGDKVLNRLREHRAARQMSAAFLAKRAGVSRQTIYAIEAGDFIPNTSVALHLARALGVSIEELFSLEDDGSGVAERKASVRVDAVLPPRSSIRMLRLAPVGSRLIAVAQNDGDFMPGADAVLMPAGKVQRVHPLHNRWRERELLVIAGCDPALALLRETLVSTGAEVLLLNAPSLQALHWLRLGWIHAAGCHLPDRWSGEFNVSRVTRLFPEGGMRLITFAAADHGLVVQAGNPKAIRDIGALARPEVTFVNRQKGSGARNLVDAALRASDVPVSALHGYDNIAEGHLAAAQAVATGTADCSVAIRSAALAFGLDFIPLATQRFDLCFRKGTVEHGPGQRMADQMTRAAFRNTLREQGGYDVTASGSTQLSS